MSIIIIGVTDLETNSKLPATATIVEAGLLKYKDGKRIKKYSNLINTKVEWEPDAKKKTGLSNKILKELGKPEDEVMGEIFAGIKNCDWLMGHNILNYDLPILKRYAKKYKCSKMLDKKLIFDTRYHLPYPEDIYTRKLLYLCAEHGFLIEGAHRVVGDIEATYKLFNQYKIKEVLAYAKDRQQLITLEAKVDFKDKHLASDANFRSRYDENNKFIGWFKEGFAIDLEKEKANWDFDSFIVESEIL